MEPVDELAVVVAPLLPLRIDEVEVLPILTWW